MWGKVLGTFFGFLFGRIVGACLGFYVGHLFDKSLRQNFEKQGGFGRYFGATSQTERQALFFYATFSVMGHIAKSNGRVTEVHIQAANMLMTHMGLNESQKRESQNAFRDGKSSDFNIKKTLKDFRRSVFARREILQMFLEIQIQGAFSDGVIEPHERELLILTGKLLGFAEADVVKLLARWEAEFRFHQQKQQNGGGQGQPASQQAMNDAYRLLGVSPDADSAEIKKAYKKQMNQHHPDKLVSKGLPPEMLEMAKAKAQDIQAAYDMVKARN
jgi:DnaJ like chaperone protein